MLQEKLRKVTANKTCEMAATWNSDIKWARGERSSELVVQVTWPVLVNLNMNMNMQKSGAWSLQIYVGYSVREVIAREETVRRRWRRPARAAGRRRRAGEARATRAQWACRATRPWSVRCARSTASEWKCILHTASRSRSRELDSPASTVFQMVDQPASARFQKLYWSKTLNYITVFKIKIHSELFRKNCRFLDFQNKLRSYNYKINQ